MEASELHDSAQSQAITNAGVIARRVIENVARVIHAPDGLLERCVMALLYAEDPARGFAPRTWERSSTRHPRRSASPSSASSAKGT